MPLTIALIGSPNCGKTTLFNRLTGSAQHVGNWPGVTVECKSGTLHAGHGKQAVITDLPGVYSLAPLTPEERIARDHLLGDPPDVILNIADATALERSLRLTLQLRALGRPMVLALNMIDEAERLGLHIDLAALERLLGMPVLPVCARTGKGVDTLAHRLFLPVAAPKGPVPDEKRLSALCGTAPVSLHWADRLLLHPLWSIPLFVFSMLGVFFIAFGPIGSGLSGWFSGLCSFGMSMASKTFFQTGVHGPLYGLIYDGALAGVSAVLGFLPSVMLLFGLLSLLEDSGYMARAAFLMDGPLSRIGLSGRCFMPLMLGFGCSVPAVLSTRTLRTARERHLSILLVPFMSCSARATVYALLVQALPPACRFPAVCSLYLLGVAAAVFTALVCHRLFPEKDASFLLEIPRWRMPTLRTTALELWHRIRDFFKRAFGVIVLSSTAVWFLQSFTPAMSLAANAQESMLGLTAGRIAPLFSPAGFGSFEAASAVIAGLIAKENIAGVLAVLSHGRIEQVFPSPLSALCFLIFTALYAPCMAAFAVMRREAGTLRALGFIIYQTLLAWLLAVCVFQLGRFAWF